MRKTFLNFAVIFLYVMFASQLVGCTTPMQREDSTLLGSENVKDKNYLIGKSLSATVGDPMVKFQDYWTTTSEKSVATFSKKVTLKGGPVEVTAIAGKQYPIAGTVIQDGVRYTLVNVGHLIMVKPDGTIRDRVAAAHTNNELIMVVWTMSISDPTVIVSKETIMQVDSRKGYENFELLYTGLSSGAINITYREFSPDGLARVAFFQNLTYPVSSKTISFKKFKIEVESVSSENIKFKVLEDGK